jgi:hypothetical protein
MKHILLLTVLLTFGAFASEFDQTMELAIEGNMAAQYNIGVMYSSGIGVEEDYEKAIEWLGKAALQGDQQAQVNLGVMHGYGQGVPINHSEAIRWFSMAAKNGVGFAQYNLGMQYFFGKGVPADKIRGASWWMLASNQGDADASNNLKIIKKEMTSTQYSEAQALAATCYESNYKDCD